MATFSMGCCIRVGGVCLFVLMAITGPSDAAAPKATIKLYSDASLTHDTYDDIVPATLNVYVVVEDKNAGGAEFRLVKNGFTGSFVLDLTPYVLIGTNSQTGIAVVFEACFPPPVYFLTAKYSAFGSSPECSTIDVAPDPSATTGDIQVLSCILPEPALGESLRINWNSNCPPLAIEATTWGKLKALYQ